ncbi:hypothetical protein AAY473_009548 [Plecturocebus cupreus]
MPVPHRAGPSWVRCACCETLSPQRFQLLFSLWGWDQPSPTILYTLHWEAPRWVAGKTAAPAKRVALATRVAPLPGISRSVGNKNSSERESVNAVLHYHKLCSRVSHIWGNSRGQHIRSAMDKPRPGKTTFVIMVSPLPETRFRHVTQAGLELLSSSDPPASASQTAGIIGFTSGKRKEETE